MYGIHLLDYPFIIRIGDAIAWGYLIAMALIMGISAGILIHYLENRNNKLTQSEARFQELSDSLPDVVFEVDLRGRLTYANKNAFAFFKATREDCGQINVFDYIVPEDRPGAKENALKISAGMESSLNEYMGLRRDGTRFPVIIRSTPVIRDGKAVGLRGFIIDITELKNNEMLMQYLSCHDSLTELLNRHGLTHAIEKFLKTNNGKVGVGFIICDVDGLKLVNDTLGHDVGDKLLKTAAGIIKEITRPEDIAARVGGDEFCIVIPLTDDGIVPRTVKKLQRKIEINNSQNPELPLSISIGYALSPGGKINIQSLFKEADDYMYRQKLHHGTSSRSAIVQTLMKALRARDFITEGHADRLQQLVCYIASAIGLSERQITDLRLLAQFHDIGKVGIPDGILFKPGPFNSDEKKEMERHCEIGYRIARSSPELAHIAEFIFKHHEWWNGGGYPLKLKEAAIPLECRILAIADAYDAMTNDRPYRKAMSNIEALAEIESNAGVQFDPFLVSKFLSIVESGLKEQGVS
ncbi:diguanylate cyclase [Desulfocucumis palustris]|nr:diguanylate cyclase [Desulfocucumis palustris]